MLRSRLVPALAVAALLTASVRADDPKSPLERVEALQKELQKKVTDLQNDMAALKTRVDGVEKTQTSLIDLAELKNRIDDLHTEIARLRTDLNSGRQSTSGYARMPDGKRDSGKTDGPRIPGPRVEAMRPAVATVRIVNEFPFTQEVLVNGSPYSLSPGASAEIPVVAGNFTYQLLGYHPFPQTRPIAPGMVKAIRIY